MTDQVDQAAALTEQLRQLAEQHDREIAAAFAIPPHLQSDQAPPAMSFAQIMNLAPHGIGRLQGMDDLQLAIARCGEYMRGLVRDLQLFGDLLKPKKRKARGWRRHVRLQKAADR